MNVATEKKTRTTLEDGGYIPVTGNPEIGGWRENRILRALFGGWKERICTTVCIVFLAALALFAFAGRGGTTGATPGFDGFGEQGQADMAAMDAATLGTFDDSDKQEQIDTNNTQEPGHYLGAGPCDGVTAPHDVATPPVNSAVIDRLVANADTRQINCGATEENRRATDVKDGGRFNPTREEMLNDMRLIALDVLFNHGHLRSAYDDIDWGGERYADLFGAGLLVVGDFECVPEGVVYGIEEIEYNELFKFDFPYANRDKDMVTVYRASNATLETMYIRYGNVALLIYDQENRVARLVTSGGKQLELSDIAPKTLKFRKDANDGAVLTYKGSDGHCRVFRLTDDSIAKVQPLDNIRAVEYDRIYTMNAAVKTGTGWERHDQEVLAMYLAVTTDSGMEVRDLNGTVLAALSYGENPNRIIMQRLDTWCFARERMREVAAQ